MLECEGKKVAKNYIPLLDVVLQVMSAKREKV
jgi:hypothetical protein